jgi:hypothetical protein
MSTLGILQEWQEVEVAKELLVVPGRVVVGSHHTVAVINSVTPCLTQQLLSRAL